MTILKAGTFKVSGKRKAFPSWMKTDLMLEMIIRDEHSKLRLWALKGVSSRDLVMDHSPALAFRDYDTEARDFIPPQHDTDHLYLMEKPDHQAKTTGRKPGAARTVTTKGSDIGEMTRMRKEQREKRKISWPKQRWPTRTLT